MQNKRPGGDRGVQLALKQRWSTASIRLLTAIGLVGGGIRRNVAEFAAIMPVSRLVFCRIFYDKP